MSGSFTWRPYIAGALAGLLAIASVWISTVVLEKPKYLGASTTFVRTAGLVEQQIVPEHVEANPYYEKTKVKIDWQMLFVVGIFVGALGSALVGGQFKVESVPPIWLERFGGSIPLRMGGALLGGIVAMFGARLAGGCPSGHGMSGLMQLSVSGYIAMAGFFGAGVIVANLVYRSGGTTEGGKSDE